MFGRIGAFFLTALLVTPLPVQAAEGARITVTGEIIDTWCYYSGVMGGPDAIQGTAHHTCALWCSAGGIPVGLLAPDGTVYMVLKIEGGDTSAGGDTALHLASHEVTADGMFYERDGINYLVVEKVVSDAGIVNETHELFGPVPPFAIPEPQ
jgi:hypothetical protein